MIWIILSVVYVILYLFVYFGMVVWLGGRKFSWKELFIDFLLSPCLFYYAIKDISVAVIFLIGQQYQNMVYKWKNRNTKIVYDPFLNKMIKVKN